MISDTYQVNLLRRSADRIMLQLPKLSGQPKLRLQELVLDLRREAHELEEALRSETISAHTAHLAELNKG